MSTFSDFHGRRAGERSPGGLHAGLVGGVIVAVFQEHTDVEMVVRNDMRDFGRHRTDGRTEVELPGEQARYAEIVIELGCRRLVQHGRFLPRRQNSPIRRIRPVSKRPQGHRRLA